MCSALPGLHAWTGCDTISVLVNQGKIISLKIVWENQKCRDVFVSLSIVEPATRRFQPNTRVHMSALLKKHTKMCGGNDLCYNMFCERKGDVESGQ